MGKLGWATLPTSGLVALPGGALLVLQEDGIFSKFPPHPPNNKEDEPNTGNVIIKSLSSNPNSTSSVQLRNLGNTTSACNFPVTQSLHLQSGTN